MVGGENEIMGNKIFLIVIVAAETKNGSKIRELIWFLVLFEHLACWRHVNVAMNTLYDGK